MSKSLFVATTFLVTALAYFVWQGKSSEEFSKSNDTDDASLDMVVSQISHHEVCSYFEFESLKMAFNQVSQSDQNKFLDKDFIERGKAISISLSMSNSVNRFIDKFGAPLLRDRSTIKQSCQQRQTLHQVVFSLREIERLSHSGELTDSLTCIVGKAASRIFSGSPIFTSPSCGSVKPRIIDPPSISAQAMNSITEARLWLNDADYDVVDGAAVLLAAANAHTVGDASGSRSQSNLSINVSPDAPPRLLSPRIKLGATEDDKAMLNALNQLRVGIADLFAGAL